ncbi:hypothetical protein CSAL01_00350 [Colletotrichum salicis]|uniref:DUF6594 domain-containing protein n=1 Tax=Colletotrichum salicis TaxID=1209931 RepID=A0A135RSW4_9PEZI|nr:hypothetical protein CSAL01_00350 [Colletotrichum salicis]
MQQPSVKSDAPVMEDEEAKKIQNAIDTLLKAAHATHQLSEKMPDSPTDMDASQSTKDEIDKTEPNSEFAWNIATKLQAKNFIRLVSRKPPILHTIYRLLNKLQMGDWGFRVNIAEMQRMHLRALQVGLVDKAAKMQVRGGEMEAEAIAKNGRLLAVRRSAAHEVRVHEAPCFAHWSLGQEENPEPLGGTRNASAKAVLRRNFWWKIMGAVVGGAFLVSPMWLLVLQRDLYLNLGVATAFTFAFGFLIVGCVDQLDQVFTSTLAYAAVLMVFVGVMFDKQFPEGV